MKTLQIKQILEETDFEIVDKNLGEIECFALIDEYKNVVMYEEKKGQTNPFEGIRFVITDPNPWNLREVSAVIM